MRRINRIKRFVNSADDGVVPEGAQIIETPVGIGATLPTSSNDPQIAPTSQFEQGKCHFLHSLLVPTDGCSSIPDDKMRLHSTRSETITYAIDVPTYGSPIPNPNTTMLFIVYPTHPGSLVGYVYSLDPDAQIWHFEQQLTTAQNLSESYDYIRKVSESIQIRSSTLPSGLYAINGTINAVRYDGTLTELDLSDPPNFYNRMLASNTNLFDKIGNVSVGDGLTILGIPDTFDIPYTRLDDTTPVNFVSGSANLNEIEDNSENIVYHLQGDGNDTPIPPSGTITQLSFNFNCDSTTGLDVLFTLYGQMTTSGTPAAGKYTYNVTFNLYDPFGNQNDTQTLERSAYWGPDYLDPISVSEVFTYPFPVYAGSTGPVGSLQIVVQISNAITGVTLSPNLGWTVKATVPIGARPGVNTPVYLACVQNVAAGSVMNVTGVANLELIPNPDLARNLPTFYGDFNGNEMQFVKHVVSNRMKYNLRSVWNTRDYSMLIPAFRDLCNLNLHDSSRLLATTPQLTNGSISWGDIKRFAKQFGPSILKTGIGLAKRAAVQYAPEAMPIIEAVGTGVNNLISSAASGVPIQMRAYADTSYCRPRLCQECGYERSCEACCVDLYNFQQMQLMLSGDVERNPGPNRSRPIPRDRAVRITKTTLSIPNSETTKKFHDAVAFPTLVKDANDTVIGGGLFVAVHGRHDDTASAKIFARSKDGFRIFGMVPTELPLVTGGDVTLLPIDPISFRKGIIDVLSNSAPVEGHSCMAAIWLLCNGWKGIYPHVISGAVELKSGFPMLVPLPPTIFLEKRMYLRSFGLPIAANDPLADYKITDLFDAMAPPKRVQFGLPYKAVAGVPLGRCVAETAQ